MSLKRLSVVIIAFWAFAQFAVIDHLYSDSHIEDNICEWCLNHSKTFVPSDGSLVTFERFISASKEPLRKSTSLVLKPAAFLLPPNRAPPVAIF